LVAFSKIFEKVI